jgi:hypothetical protein
LLNSAKAKLQNYKIEKMDEIGQNYNLLSFHLAKGAFTLANFARDFALSLHVLLNKNYLFSLLNVQASAKSRAKSRQCKRTLMHKETCGRIWELIYSLFFVNYRPFYCCTENCPLPLKRSSLRAS